MRIGLVYPPSKWRNNECFTLPNASLPVLADRLRRAGHEAVFFDFDIGAHRLLRDPSLADGLSTLTDPSKVLPYLSGDCPPRTARRLRAVTTRIMGSVRLTRCDLFGITLADLWMTQGQFLLNSAALIAHEIKARFGAPVVLGNGSLPRQVYREILEKYPCFDYAVWAHPGEHSLLRLAQRLDGSRVRLIQTLARDGAALRAHAGRLPDGPCFGPDFSGYPLGKYRVPPERLLRSYDAEPRLVRPLLTAAARRRSQLIVPYRFESICRGRCAFCENDARVPSDCKGIDRILEDLSLLKRLGVTGVYFTNPNFNNRYAFASELCDRMIEARLGLQWSDCANFRELDEDLLRRMREAGAVKLVFGLETASDRLLRYIRKGITRTRVERYLRLSHELGIWNHIELIGGLPTETDDDIRQTADFIRANAPYIDTYALNPFYLYRSAPFCLEAGRFGLRLLRRNPRAEDLLGTRDPIIGNVSERFAEIGGLGWEEKDAQIKRSTRIVAETIAEVSSFGAIDQDHIHLLMFLYARFGHARKGTIRAVFRRATRRFMPYNLDQFLLCTGFYKQDYRRVAGGVS
jgi:radical SAM superfamily enzyme YgiQ (UPF0313 family)